MDGWAGQRRREWFNLFTCPVFQRRTYSYLLPVIRSLVSVKGFSWRNIFSYRIPMISARSPVYGVRPQLSRKYPPIFSPSACQCARLGGDMLGVLRILYFCAELICPASSTRPKTAISPCMGAF